MKKSLYFIKKIIRKLYHLIWFLSVWLILAPNVFAIPTGEIYSETNSSNITLLSKFQYASGEVRLYGRSGSGQSNPFIPSLNEFRDGNYSLFTYQSIPGGTRTNFGMHFYLNKTLMAGKSYTSTFKVAGTPGTVQYYFSNAINVNNANLNSKSVTCLSGSCFVNTTFTMSSSTNELHIDFAPNEGLNGQIFVDIFTGIFMVQVEEYNYLDTSGIQNNQQIIINQNDEIINNNNNNTNRIDESINGVDDTLKDETAPSIDLSDIETSDTPISDLITLPLTLLNSIYNGISGSCSNWTLPLPFDHSVLLECFTISDYVGNNVATIIDTAICLFMAYRIILLFIAVFNDITTLSDTYTNYVKRGRY